MTRKVVFFTLIVAVFAFYISLTCTQNPLYGGGEDVDTQDPSIKVSNPTSGSYVTADFTLNGTCSDNDKVAKVEIGDRVLVESKSMKKEGILMPHHKFRG